MYWRIHFFYTDILFSYIKILNECWIDLFIPSSVPLIEFFSIMSIAHYLITISLWHILIFIRLISPHFYFFIIFLEILTCLFFCINIWFNLSTYFKSNLSFYRDQIKLCTKLIITEIFIILIFLTNNTVAFPLLKTVFCASQSYFKVNFITMLFNNHIKCKCFNDLMTK